MRRIDDDNAGAQGPQCIHDRQQVCSRRDQHRHAISGSDTPLGERASKLVDALDEATPGDVPEACSHRFAQGDERRGGLAASFELLRQIYGVTSR